MVEVRNKITTHAIIWIKNLFNNVTSSLSFDFKNILNWFIIKYKAKPENKQSITNNNFNNIIIFLFFWRFS